MPRARGRRFKPAAHTVACVGGSRADSQPPVMSNWLNNQAWLEWNLKCERGSFSEYFGSVLHNCTLTIKLGAKGGLGFVPACEYLPVECSFWTECFAVNFFSFFGGQFNNHFNIL